MAKYTLFFINAADHILRSEQIDCSSDEQATQTARQETGDHQAVQIWAGERPVGLVGNLREADKFQ